MPCDICLRTPHHADCPNAVHNSEPCTGCGNEIYDYEPREIEFVYSAKKRRFVEKHYCVHCAKEMNMDGYGYVSDYETA
jgi:hypothetical protein